MIDTQRLIQELDARYGAGSGAKICMTVLPGILADFQKMLTSAAPGKTMREEYRLDDGKGSILLSGVRTPSGKLELEAAFKDIAGSAF